MFADKGAQHFTAHPFYHDTCHQPELQGSVSAIKWTLYFLCEKQNDDLENIRELPSSPDRICFSQIVTEDL